MATFLVSGFSENLQKEIAALGIENLGLNICLGFGELIYP